MSARHKKLINQPVSKNLGSTSVRSGLINLVSQGGSVTLQVLSTVVLARLLTPSAYGTVGMVTVVIAFASLFKDLGLSTATIQRKDLNYDQVSNMFWANVLVGFGLTLLLSLLSPLVASFYNRPELVKVTSVLSINILLSSLGAQHSALLTRNMRFKHLAVCRLSAALTTFIVSLIAALFHLEYWALVAGTLAGSVVSVILLWSFNPWRPGRPKRGTGVKSMLTYGLNLTGFDLVNYFSRNLDNILIGRFWGSQTLGYYTRAYSLLLFPVQNIRGPLTAVALPAMSRLQGDPARFRLYYCKLVAVLGLFCMPISTFCFVCPEWIIEALLGEQWLKAASVTRWLSLSSFLQPVAGVFGIVLMASGLAHRHFRCGLISSIVISLTFLISVRFGVETLALAYALSGYILFIPIFLYASKGTGIHIIDFLRGTWKPALTSFMAGCSLFFLRSFFYSENVWLLLFQGMILFSLSYISILMLLPHGREELMELLSRVLKALNL